MLSKSYDPKITAEHSGLFMHNIYAVTKGQEVQDYGILSLKTGNSCWG